jgi:hypothetical protein
MCVSEGALPSVQNARCLFLNDLKLWEFAGARKLQDLGLCRVEGLV